MFHTDTLRRPCLAFALGVLVLLPFLGQPLVSREQELRVVLTARDMMRGGDWLVPRYLGEPRLNKPPLQYWLTALAFRAGGSSPSPFLARLPTALLGAALLAAIAGLGATLVGAHRAAIAAAVAGTSVLFWRFGRLAETDIPLACLESLAVMGLYVAGRLRRPTPARFAWAGVGLAAGVGFMIKGPAAIVLPALAWVTFRYTTPRVRRAPLPAIPLLIATGVCLLVLLPWYASVIFGPSSAAAVKDIAFEMGALGPKTKHAGNPLYYLYTLPLLLLPWSLVLPWIPGRLRRLVRRHEGVRWLACWLLSSLLALSLLPSKQPQYATLLLTPMALAITVGLGTRLRRLYRAGPLRRLVVTVMILLLTSLWLTGALFHELRYPVRIFTSIAGDVKRLAAPDSRIFLAGRKLHTTQYYLDRPIHGITSLEDGLRQADADDLIILAADEHNAVLPAAPAIAPLVSRRQGSVTMQIYRPGGQPRASAAPPAAVHE